MKEFLKAKQLLEGSLSNSQPQKQLKTPSVDFFNKSAAKTSSNILQPVASNPLSTIAQLSQKSATSKESELVTVTNSVATANAVSVKPLKVSMKSAAELTPQISRAVAKSISPNKPYQQAHITTRFSAEKSALQVQQSIASQSLTATNVEQVPIKHKQRIRLTPQTLEVTQDALFAKTNSVIEPIIAANVTENSFGGFAASSSAKVRKSNFRKPKAKFQLFDKTTNGIRSKSKPVASVSQSVVKPTTIAPDVTEFDTADKFAVSEKNNVSSKINKQSSSKSNVKPYVFDSSKKRGVKSRRRAVQIKPNKSANAKFDGGVIFKKLSGVSKKAFTPIVSVSSAAHSTVVGSVKNQYQKQSQSILDRFVAKVEASKTSAIHKIRANFDLSQPFSGKFDKSNLEPDQAFISEHNFKSIVQLSSFVILVMLCLSFTVNLWLNSEHGFGFRNQMIQDLALIHTEIDEIVVANTQLEKEIFNYREDKQSVESMVRYELGMIKPNETFVRIIR